MPRRVADEIRLYGTLLGLSEAECDAMASGGSAKAKRLCMRDLRRRYREENAVSESERRSGLEQVEFWRDALPSSRFVYFIQEGRLGPVKIGLANDPRVRLGQLQTGNPSELLVRHAVPGDLALEKQLHYRFREARVRGEWFGLAYLKVILLFAEGLSHQHISCYERERSTPIVLAGGRHVMSAAGYDVFKRDLQRVLLVYSYSRDRDRVLAMMANDHRVPAEVVDDLVHSGLPIPGASLGIAPRRTDGRRPAGYWRRPKA